VQQYGLRAVVGDLVTVSSESAAHEQTERGDDADENDDADADDDDAKQRVCALATRMSSDDGAL
jgi:hypothetical protein